jgi:hypothetical protein
VAKRRKHPIRFKRLSCPQAREIIAKTLKESIFLMEFYRLRQHLRHCSECFSFWERIWKGVISITLKSYLITKGYRDRNYVPLYITRDFSPETLKELETGQLTKTETRLVKRRLRLWSKQNSSCNKT